LDFCRTDGQVVIEWVDPDGPAAKCGIRTKDVIKSVGRIDASQTRLFVLRKALSQPGERVRIVIERGSKTVEKELVLPSLVSDRK
jgi:S1-C subfamily serine protease